MTKYLENTETSDSTKPVLTTAFLAPYLPYNLLGKQERNETFYYLATFSNSLGKGIENRTIETWVNENFKPILKPFSDINIDELRCRFNYPFLKIDECSIDGKLLISINSNQDFSYELYSYLLSQHFDIFGLIKKGLAISRHFV